MSHIAIVVILTLVNWWTFRAVSRYLAQKRQASATPVAGERARQPAMLPSPDATESVVSAAEPTAQAFPVYGLPPGGNGASVLEGLLRRVGGVTRAYVSPVTALAYLDYLPAQVTEEQLVGAIRSGGYRVGDAAQRFDWRHGQKS